MPTKLDIAALIALKTLRMTALVSRNFVRGLARWGGPCDRLRARFALLNNNRALARAARQGSLPSGPRLSGLHVWLCSSLKLKTHFVLEEAHVRNHGDRIPQAVAYCFCNDDSSYLLILADGLFHPSHVA
jgi:hypothetical protein